MCEREPESKARCANTNTVGSCSLMSESETRIGVSKEAKAKMSAHSVSCGEIKREPAMQM